MSHQIAAIDRGVHFQPAASIANILGSCAFRERPAFTVHAGNLDWKMEKQTVSPSSGRRSIHGSLH